MNDGLLETEAAASPAANAYMELDFGSGGRMTDKVVVGHVQSADYLCINGVTMMVMDEQRNVIFQYTFADFTTVPPVRSEFVIS